MKRIKILIAMLYVTVLSLALLPGAKGSDWDKKTIVTINAPVEVPSVDQRKVIGPGTYVFKIMDSTSTDRNVVQVWNKDETQLIATTLTIPDYRDPPPDTPVISFGENVADAPPVVKEWFYPGENYGWEFVYPKSRAMEIAKVSKQNVLATTEQSTEPKTLMKAPVMAVTPQGENAEVASAAHPKH